MKNFYLIQRGEFKDYKFLDSAFARDFLTVSNIVELDYMGSAEFEWGAIPKAYTRMLYNFLEYDFFNTGIFTPENEELIVFCKKTCSEAIINEIREFIEKPYRLKEYSELEKIPKATRDDKSYNGRRSDFWWNIDITETYGDWMAFLSPQKERLKKALEYEYNAKWIIKGEEEREKLYRDSLHW